MAMSEEQIQLNAGKVGLLNMFKNIGLLEETLDMLVEAYDEGYWERWGDNVRDAISILNNIKDDFRVIEGYIIERKEDDE